MAADGMSDQADYYRESGGADLAERFELSVYRSIQSLRVMTERGSPCRFRAAKLKGLRWIPVSDFPFRIFYLFDVDLSLLSIVHVLHEKRTMAKLLKEATSTFRAG